jgi:hypothetical protein
MDRAEQQRVLEQELALFCGERVPKLIALGILVP